MNRNTTLDSPSNRRVAVARWIAVGVPAIAILLLPGGIPIAVLAGLRLRWRRRAIRRAAAADATSGGP